MNERLSPLSKSTSGKNTSKLKGAKKYYLVVEYDKGMLAFWGTAMEYGKFLDLQNKGVVAPSHIEL